MKIIGVTGGVGCGKSAVLDELKDRYGAFVLKADEAANALKNPGEAGYDRIVDLLGKEILGEYDRIDNRKMASKIFADPDLLRGVNEILHPLVRERILQTIEEKRAEGISLFVLEAALLLEEGYDRIVDEMWYIYASEPVRKKRLAESRGYSEEKTRSIMEKQLSEEAFRKGCSVVIDNSGEFSDTKKQIEPEIRRLMKTRS